MTPRVREILSWYSSDNPGVINNLARLLNHGRLGGTGKALLYSSEEAVSCLAGENFSPNPDSFDPAYHFASAMELGFSGLVAPSGLLQFCARDYAGEIPTILKIDSLDLLYKSKGPRTVFVDGVEEALRLGCVGVSFGFYPGSKKCCETLKELGEITATAKESGLFVHLSVKPQGKFVSENEKAPFDFVAHSVHQAYQLGAHIVSVESPGEKFSSEAAQGLYNRVHLSGKNLCDRSRHIVDMAFSGQRLLLVQDDSELSFEKGLDELRQVAQGGFFGAVIGRRGFSSPVSELGPWVTDVISGFSGFGK